MRLTFILAICGFAFATSAEAGSMTFKLTEVGCPGKKCSKVLLAQGEIKYDSDRAFRSAFQKAGRGTPIILNSPGGNLMGGMRLGMAFRMSGASVRVAPGGGCYSACAYALFGGVNRKVSGSELGVHEFFDPSRAAKMNASERKEMIDLLYLYAEVMGISPEVVSIAMKTRAKDMTVLNPGQLKRLRVTN